MAGGRTRPPTSVSSATRPVPFALAPRRPAQSVTRASSFLAWPVWVHARRANMEMFPHSPARLVIPPVRSARTPPPIAQPVWPPLFSSHRTTHASLSVPVAGGKIVPRTNASNAIPPVPYVLDRQHLVQPAALATSSQGQLAWPIAPEAPSLIQLRRPAILATPSARFAPTPRQTVRPASAPTIWSPVTTHACRPARQPCTTLKTLPLSSAFLAMLAAASVRVPLQTVLCALQPTTTMLEITSAH